MFVKTPRLSAADIIERYRAGESLTMVALRAKVSDAHIRSILRDAGVPLRSANEAQRLGLLEMRRRSTRKGERQC